jgi:tetratricopeptide (TPR) repeat protein
MRALSVSRLAASVALAAAALGASGCAAKTTEVQRLQARAAYERGLADLGENRTGAGLAGLREAAALDGQVALYHNTLGKYLLNMKLPGPRAEAIGHFRRAVELEPVYADAHHSLGLAYNEESRWEDAISEFRKALSIPTFSMPDLAYFNLGWALYSLGRFPEAEESLMLAIRLNPQHPTLPAAYYTLGLVLVKQGRTEEAKAAFRRAREVDNPSSAWGASAAQHLRALGEGG